MRQLQLRQVGLILPLLTTFGASGMPIYASSQPTGTATPTGEPARIERSQQPEREPEREPQPSQQADQSDRENGCDDYRVVRDRSDHEAPILPRSSIAARAIQNPNCRRSAQPDP